jgi:threonyl-tRNA synthetase
VGHLKTGFVRPVIVHRAIFGSLERFIAILCEHTGGKWDFWISPRQIQLIPMGSDAEEFTEEVYNTLLLQGYSVGVDRSGDTFNKKIMNAQKEGFNYIGVIGKAEVQEKAINLRKRDEAKEIGKVSIPELLKLFEGLRPIKSKKRE